MTTQPHKRQEEHRCSRSTAQLRNSISAQGQILTMACLCDIVAECQLCSCTAPHYTNTLLNEHSTCACNVSTVAAVAAANPHACTPHVRTRQPLRHTRTAAMRTTCRNPHNLCHGAAKLLACHQYRMPALPHDAPHRHTASHRPQLQAHVQDPNILIMYYYYVVLIN